MRKIYDIDVSKLSKRTQELLYAVSIGARMVMEVMNPMGRRQVFYDDEDGVMHKNMTESDMIANMDAYMDMSLQEVLRLPPMQRQAILSMHGLKVEDIDIGEEVDETKAEVDTILMKSIMGEGVGRDGKEGDEVHEEEKE